MDEADCDFCDLDGFRSNSTLVVENEICLFANSDDGENETLCGSGIIIPKVHRPTVFDLSPAEITATFALLNEVRPVLDQRYRPDGYTIGWNCYAGSGQAVMHAHLHVLVRFTDEPLAGKGIRWFYRQDDNRRPDPHALGSGTTSTTTTRHAQDPFAYLQDRVTVVDADPNWPDDFEGLASTLRDALGPLALRVDHIGSTAIPGLPAKDVIDVQVTVRSLEPRERFVAAFAAIGFTQRSGDWNLRDTPPPDWHGDPVAWDKLVFTPPADGRRSNVHVRVAGSPNARRALLRDYLRSNAAARQSWGDFKKTIAVRGATLASYGQVKQPATDVLMATAEAWAHDNGWQIGPAS